MILSRSPHTGAEVMDEMERMSAGYWRPSPGSVYPLLEELTQEGLVRRREDGRYELLKSASGESGWRFAAPGPRTAEEAVRDLGALAAYLEDLSRADAKALAGSQPALREAIERLTKLAK
jgi:DNA-binding PadR family transcriptional regulator